MNYERITADDVRVGDQIARAKTHRFERVVSITEGPIARRFELEYEGGEAGYGERKRYYGGSIRPRRTAKLWRLNV